MASPAAQPFVAGLRAFGETRRRRRMGTIQQLTTINGIPVAFCSLATSDPADSSTWGGPFGLVAGVTFTVGNAVWVWAWPPQWLVLGLRSTA